MQKMKFIKFISLDDFIAILYVIIMVRFVCAFIFTHTHTYTHTHCASFSIHTFIHSCNSIIFYIWCTVTILPAQNQCDIINHSIINDISIEIYTEREQNKRDFCSKCMKRCKIAKCQSTKCVNCITMHNVATISSFTMCILQPHQSMHISDECVLFKCIHLFGMCT